MEAERDPGSRNKSSCRQIRLCLVPQPVTQGSTDPWAQRLCGAGRLEQRTRVLSFPA